MTAPTLMFLREILHKYTSQFLSLNVIEHCHYFETKATCTGLMDASNSMLHNHANEILVGKKQFLIEVIN